MQSFHLRCLGLSILMLVVGCSSEDVVPVSVAPNTEASVTDENSVAVKVDVPIEPEDVAAPEIPQEVIDAPLRKVVQRFPDKKPHRAFTAKVLGKNKVVPHGKFLEFYSTGQKQKEAEYDYGQKSGVWNFYSKEGVLTKTGSYEKDRQEGEWKKFRKDGTLEWVETYRRGREHGTWIAYAKDGTTVIWKRSYMYGKRHGAWEKFHPNGTLSKREIYANDQLAGKSETWFESGQLRAEGSYVDGKRHGAFRSYGPGGNLQNEANWENGKEVF